MKRTNRCPKCQSTDVVANARPLDMTEAGERPADLATYQNPSAWLFKGQLSTTMSAWVCAGCGYVELYADNPKILKLRDEKWK